MIDDTNLQDHGYLFDASTEIWSRPGFSSIAYNDGDEAEQRLARIIAEISDLSVLSAELHQHCTDWPSLYHLSRNRANILRPLNDELRGARVLEIGAGCGAITRYLGEAGAEVLALEGSVRRATIARSRTRDLNNVVVLADRFAEFEIEEQFDIITLIGVLEYANLFTPGHAPAAAMLQRVRTLLKPEGKLVIAIENQIGLKYLAGAPEDHVGVPLYGVENRYRKDQPQTFGHKVLSRLLQENGFAGVRSFLPFPDYKFPSSILSESSLATPGFDASVFAWQNVRRDPQFPAHINFCQELAWPAVFDNSLALQLSNSFLLIAEPKPSDAETQEVLAYHFSTERRLEFCKETLFKVDADGIIVVHCRKLEPSSNAKIGEAIQFTLKPETKYVSGSPMSWQFVEIATRRGWTISDIAEFFRAYRASLIAIMQERNISSAAIPGDGDFDLPGEFLDIIPQNIIVSAAGKYSVIDEEWRAISNVRFSQLIFRSLLAMSGMISYFGRSASDSLSSWRSILEALFQELKLEWLPQTESELIEFELKVQEVVNGSFKRGHFTQWLESQPHNQMTLYDVQDDNKADRDRLIADYHTKSLAWQADLEGLNSQLESLNSQLVELRSSSSWKLTAPIRLLAHQIKRVRHLMRLGPSVIRRKGGLR